MSTPRSPHPLHDSYDVIVLGGALSGAATATLLQRWNPGIKVLILERTEVLGRRVGEATVEVSAYFLSHILDLTRYLNEHHIAKQGLRFWFGNEQVQTLDQASEVGPRYQVRLPSYQLDRATLDEEVLSRAVAQGAHLLRPALIRRVDLCEGGLQSVHFTYEGQEFMRQARWVVDASGVAALLARKNGWWRRNEEHPTAALWSRWSGVKDWDGVELAQRYPEWAKATYGIRGTATNHLVGEGWWAWMIPLKGGDTSIGIVFDQRIVQWERGGEKLGERLKQFLCQHPVGRELLAEAQFEAEDVHWRRHLAYRSERLVGDGFVLVGDAAAFMDPFYSPGMDWISFTTASAAQLITEARQGKVVKNLVHHHQDTFTKSLDRWFNSLYKDKYYYMGEWDLLNLAFQMDLLLYYAGVVEPAFKHGIKAFFIPPFSPTSGAIFSRLMSCYNARFAAIARRRKRLGMLGKHNAMKRNFIPGFTLERSDLLKLPRLLSHWLKLELTEGWKCTAEDRVSPKLKE